MLSTGNWFRLGVTHAGVYRLDLAFLQSLGVGAQSIPSASIRIFGNGGAILPENNSAPVIDDLRENAIQVVDGGDGVLNGTDYILFYSPGPHQWVADQPNRSFHHIKNLYSDTSFYFLSLAGQGKRMPIISQQLQPTVLINSYTDRYEHELDTFNFLSSGKDWFGEEFSQGPGKVLSREYAVPTFPAATGNAVIRVKAVARSFGGPSSFTVSDGNQLIGQINIAPVATGPYDQFARTDSALVTTILSSTFRALTIAFAPASVNSQGWLDWFEVFAERRLDMQNLPAIAFRTYQGISAGAVAQFTIANCPALVKVWEVTDPFSAIQHSVQNNQGTVSWDPLESTCRHASLSIL